MNEILDYSLRKDSLIKISQGCRWSLPPTTSYRKPDNSKRFSTIAPAFSNACAGSHIARKTTMAYKSSTAELLAPVSTTPYEEEQRERVRNKRPVIWVKYKHNFGNSKMSDVATTTNRASASDEVDFSDELTPQMLEALNVLAAKQGILEHKLECDAIAGVGENSFGLILSTRLIPTRTHPTFAPVRPVHCIVKIAPKNVARRAHMRVADYYRREVFMYDRVFHEFRQLWPGQTSDFSAVAPMHHFSLAPVDEFIIFEDLRPRGFTQNARDKSPTYDLVRQTFEAVSQLHALSFALQAKKPVVFNELVSQMDDNLFTEDIAAVSIEFGKSYLRRTRHLLANDGDSAVEEQKALLLKIEEHFKQICLHCVDGGKCRPYAVVCHGDFWNNNILYKHNSEGVPIEAKLIDFQMSRYAAPVLDLVRYLFCCTEKPLRDAYFHQLMAAYYSALERNLRQFTLEAEEVYPRRVFFEQLQQYGVYGMCMAAFSIPFFISNNSELRDLDEVCEAIDELPDAQAHNDVNNAPETVDDGDKAKDVEKCVELIEEYDLLTERTLPIFKRRMAGNIEDIVKYKMNAYINSL